MSETTSSMRPYFQKQPLLFLHLVSQNFAHLIQNIEDFGVSHFHHHLHPVLASSNQMALLHQGDMTGDVGLFTINGWNDFADTFFSVPEQFQDLQTGGLGKGL